ncbi:MAG: uroporphyrinogen decarboxylase family protein, partial [Clostridia bacterium]|nr:uroporphyrinogen decarboxylase family protein [Clostridia bacterium]
KGVELVIIHDDIASTRGLILSPDWLREYAFPWHKRIFDAIHEKGKKVLYISDGNYLDALPDIMANGPDGLYVESSSMDPGVLMNIAGRDKLYLIKTDSRITDYGNPGEIREELLKLRELHDEFPGMMIYRGGGSVNKANAREFDRLYAELLIYDQGDWSSS